MSKVTIRWVKGHEPEDAAPASASAPGESPTDAIPGKCEVCGATPVMRLTGMCGPCTTGEADTVNGNW